MSGRDGSFLSRWSRRKAQGREGVALPDDATTTLPVAAATPQPAPTPTGAAVLAPMDRPAAAGVQATQTQAPTHAADVAPPAPTLADVAGLTAQSDYTRFMAHGVTPEVKNAALKKLFTDPHFNLMDGLDTYVDDYGTPDPLPAGMLRKMAQSQLLGLFDDENMGDTADAVQAAPPAATAVRDTPAVTGPTALPGPIDNEVRPPPLDAVAVQCSAGPGVDKTI